jgi:Ca-activated chloride channel family protein
MLRGRAILTRALVFGFLLTKAWAQDETPVFKAGTALVDLHVSVLDKNGRLISGIPQSAFKVLENGVEQPISVFSREDVPVSMALVIDNSGSMRYKREEVAAAAMALVTSSNPQDEVCIVNFDDRAYLDLPFTNDLKKLRLALAQLKARGGTAMRDAISGSIDYMRKKASKDKKVLLVITDGNDNTSRVTLDQAVTEARQSGVLVYSIGILTDEDFGEARSAKRALKALAEASGGVDYYPKNLRDIEKITPQIAQEIRNQYILGYQPTHTELDGSFRQIKVAIAGFGKPTIRTRNGYYATANANGANPKQ